MPVRWGSRRVSRLLNALDSSSNDTNSLPPPSRLLPELPDVTISSHLHSIFSLSLSRALPLGTHQGPAEPQELQLLLGTQALTWGNAVRW